MRVPMSPCSEGSIRDAAVPGMDRRFPSMLHSPRSDPVARANVAMPGGQHT